MEPLHARPAADAEAPLGAGLLRQNLNLVVALGPLRAEAPRPNRRKPLEQN